MLHQIEGRNQRIICLYQNQCARWLGHHCLHQIELWYLSPICSCLARNAQSDPPLPVPAKPLCQTETMYRSQQTRPPKSPRPGHMPEVGR